jgi:hypothetical protein
VDGDTRRGSQDLQALERASVGEDIVPLADFLSGFVKKGLAGEPLPHVPNE